jgi:CheY-like chemotaxis protein
MMIQSIDRSSKRRLKRLDVQFAADGVDLIDQLSKCYARPSIIMLDLIMPKKNGRETLVELKADPRWRAIPVVVHSVSDSREDISFCYQHGVNSYVIKPKSYEKLKENLKGIVTYWFKTASLPSVNGYKSN